MTRGEDHACFDVGWQTDCNALNVLVVPNAVTRQRSFCS
jgi:hypothetical protein